MKPAAPKSPERQDAVRKSFGLEAKSDPTAVPQVQDSSASPMPAASTPDPNGDALDGETQGGGAQALMNDPNAMQALDQLSQMGYTSDDVKAAMDSMQAQPMPGGEPDGDENAL